MDKPLLSDLRIQELVEILLAQIRVFDVQAARKRNLIDPFATLLENFEFGYQSLGEWENAEFSRQRQKNLMNKVGELHQRIIGRLDGWDSHEAGTGMPDVIGIRGRQKMIVEVKNKHNTMSDTAKKGTYNSLAEFLGLPEYRGFIGVVVHIISPKERGGEYWKPFTASGCPPREDIIVMNGRTFYTIAVDPQQRQPTVDFDAREDLRRWPTWSAIDEMVEQFFQSVAAMYGGDIPEWVRAFVPQALSD